MIYCQVVFHRHSGMADNLTGETVNRKDMGHPEHHQFLILIYVYFVTHVFGAVWHWI